MEVLAPVKGPSEHQVVIAGELAQANMELPIVNQPTGFADDEEREDDPVIMSVRMPTASASMKRKTNIVARAKQTDRLAAQELERRR